MFTIYDAGFEPVAAMALDDSAKSRLSKIVGMLKESRYSIHDLCRADEPRFNMPFEMGLALGMAEANHLSQRETLVLATSRTKFDRTCSDLRGVDPRIYKGKAGLVREVTRWLQQFFDHRAYVPSPIRAAARYQDFWRGLPHAMAQEDRDYLNPTWPEMLAAVHAYLEKHPPSRP